MKASLRRKGIIAVAGAISAAVVGVSTQAASPVTITWFVRSSPTENYWERNVAIPEFEKLNPGIKVNLVIVPWAQFDDKLTAMAAAGDTPEVWSHWGPSGWRDYQVRGLIQSLEPYVKKFHYSVQLAKIPAPVRHIFDVNGQPWGIPFATQPTVMFYNKTLFEKYHVPLPPTSWTDKSWNYNTMIKDAKLLTHNYNNPAKAVWGLNWESWDWFPTVWQWGADPFNSKGGPQYSSAYRTGIVKYFNVKNPKIVAAEQWQADLALKLHVAPLPSQMSILSSFSDPFLSGRIAMEGPACSGCVLSAIRAAKPKFQWGVAPVPYGPANDWATLYTDPWMLGAGSHHPNAGFKLIMYLTHGVGLQKYIAMTGFFPADSSLYNTWAESVAKLPGFSQDVSTLKNVMIGALYRGWESPNHTVYRFPEFDSAWSNNMQLVFTGKQTAAQGLAKVQAAWQRVVASLSH